MASTANRLIEVMALSKVYIVALRIVEDTVHLRLTSMLRPMCYYRVNISRRTLLME
jgi:hypothetical protein